MNVARCGNTFNSTTFQRYPATYLRKGLHVIKMSPKQFTIVPPEPSLCLWTLRVEHSQKVKYKYLI